MTIYWTLFIYPIFFALIEKPRKYFKKPRLPYYQITLWIISSLVLIIFIGLRDNVGGDWGSYQTYFFSFENRNLIDILNPAEDIGYALINWIIAQYGLSVHFVNLVCAIIFSSCLCYFCSKMERPFLALTVSFPYLILVVAMGYTRQSVAIGLSMLAIQFLIRKSFIKFFIIIFLAALFHKTAIALFALGVFVSAGNKLTILIASLFLAALLSISGVFSEYYDLYRYYIIDDYQSQGAAIRVALLIPPALLFLMWFKHFNFLDMESRIWKLFAIGSITLMIGLLFTDASTAIDRLALYLLPLQLAIFSSLPDTIKNAPDSSSVLIIFIVILYLMVMFVWLNFAYHSLYWLPYKNLLFELI